MFSDSRSGMSFQAMALFVVVLVVLLFILLMVVFGLIEARDAQANLVIERDAIQKQLEEATNSLATITGERDTLTKEKQEIASRMEEQGQVSSKESTETKAAIEKLTSEKEELATGLAAANTAKEELEKLLEQTKAEATTKSTESQATLKAMTADVEKLQAELANAIKEKDTLAQELQGSQTKQTEIAELAKNAEEALIEKLNQAEMSLEKANNQVAELTANMTSLQKSHDELSARNKAALADKDRLDKELAGLKSELEQARKTPPAPPKEELQKLIASEIKAGQQGTLNELKTLRGTVEAMQKQLQAVEAEIKTSNESPAAEESASAEN